MNGSASRGTLTVKGVTKVYPGTTALASVDLQINPGEVVALCGENGAGKSTLAKIIAGVEQPTAGAMAWDGRPYRPADPAAAIGQGIGMIHQEMRLLPQLTVAENVVVGRWPARRGGWIDRRAMNTRAAKILAELGFARPISTLVHDLSVAAQQQVEIAKAILLDARLLILDEPTAALGDAEADALFACIERLRLTGMSFIYVSHRLAEIARIADRIVVLRDGAMVAHHETAQVPTDVIVSEMVGRSVDRLFPDIQEPSGDAVLSVKDVTAKAGLVEPVSFDVRAGEVFGIAGLVGAGRTELVRAITGADPSSRGTVAVAGREIPRHSVSAAVDHGVVMVPEDRKQQGLIVSKSIEENIAFPSLRCLGPAGWVKPGKVRAMASAAISSMGVKGRPEASVSSLSGGNQQKVVIGKWLARSPKVVILDEPTRGIDVGARAAIYDVIAELGRQGVAVVVVSSDLDEVLGLSHRVLVMSRGRARGVLQRVEATPEAVMTLATS